MNTEINHPSKKTLFDFAQGKLEQESLDQVAAHVENCATCVEFLEQSINDTLVDQLREAAAENSELEAQSFEVNQTIQFSAQSAPAKIEDVLSDHPKYKVLEKIGSGGMGAVFRAEHRLMGREVAIKLIREEFVSNREAVARFQNEVRAAARLSHRNIVAAYDAEQAGSNHFLVMEYVVGESLAQRVRARGKLPITHACNYALQVAHGLKHAHENGMIHRDIKPQNLMKTPKGVIKILDFGLARIGDLQDDDSQLTSTGVMMGTADYIAPEQARNARDADIRSDLYSLGCTFFFLLAGHPPFQAVPSRVDKILSHCSGKFPEIEKIRADVPQEVVAILNKLVAPDPADRFQSPAEVIEVLLPFGKPGSKKSNEETQVDDPSGLVEVPTLIQPNVVNPVPPAAHQPSESAVPSNASAQSFTTAPPKPEIKSSSQLSQPQAPTIDSPTHSHLSNSPPNEKQGLNWPTFTGVGGGGVVVLLLLMYAFGFFGGSGSGQSDETPNTQQSGQNSQQSGGSKNRSVAFVFVYEQFCFGDFGPLRDELQRQGFDVVTAASTKRLVRYIDFPADETPNKENVLADFSYEELVTETAANPYDAVVFIGGVELSPGVTDLDSPSERQLRSVIENVREQQGWLCAVGKGINVPYANGHFNQTTIVDAGDWLEVARRNEVTLIPQTVHVDELNRIMTASQWIHSQELGEKLAQRLSQ